MIVRVGKKYILYTKDKKRKLGEFTSRAAAERRERQIVRAKYAKQVS